MEEDQVVLMSLTRPITIAKAEAIHLSQCRKALVPNSAILIVGLDHGVGDPRYLMRRGKKPQVVFALFGGVREAMSFIFTDI